MITDSTRLSLIAQIANLFFKNNNLGKASCIVRMKTYFNNESFDYFVSRLSQGTFYVATHTFDGVITVPHTGQRIYHYSMKLIDVIRGTGQNNPQLLIPESVINVTPLVMKPYWTKLAHLWDLDFVVVDANENYAIIHSPDVGTYGIELGSGTPSGGGETGGSGNSGGGGSIVIKPPINKGGTGTPDTSAPQTASIFGNLDLNSLLLPGIIVLAAYFFLKD